MGHSEEPSIILFHETCFFSKRNGAVAMSPESEGFTGIIPFSGLGVFFSCFFLGCNFIPNIDGRDSQQIYLLLANKRCLELYDSLFDILNGYFVSVCNWTYLVMIWIVPTRATKLLLSLFRC